jgi:hypothetical protein
LPAGPLAVATAAAGQLYERFMIHVIMSNLVIITTLPRITGLKNAVFCGFFSKLILWGGPGPIFLFSNLAKKFSSSVF